MDTQRIKALAETTHQAVALVFDPTAPDPAEAWLACVGLDSYGVAAEPYRALQIASAQALADEIAIARD